MAPQLRKLIVTADLHFGAYPSGDACTRALAEFVCKQEPDVLAIAGDIGTHEPQTFADCLALFDDCAPTRMLVPGNHDVWRNGEDSEPLYKTILPQMATEAGFHMLDTGSLTVGDTAFVGNIAWYDYSMRNPALGLSDEEYAAKTLPGVCTWNDLRFVNWDWSDAEFTQMCLDALREQYAEVADTENVIAMVHHLPLRELAYPPARKAFEFVRAYMGSERLGAMMAEWPNLRYVFCGHRHSPARARCGAVEAFCVGSEYRRKRLLEIDLEAGTFRTHLFAEDGVRPAVHSLESEWSAPADDAKRPEGKT